MLPFSIQICRQQDCTLQVCFPRQLEDGVDCWLGQAAVASAHKAMRLSQPAGATLPRARPLLASRAALAANCSAKAAWVWLPGRSPGARGARPRLAARSVPACGPLPVLAERRAAGLAGPRLLA